MFPVMLSVEKSRTSSTPKVEEEPLQLAGVSQLAFAVATHVEVTARTCMAEDRNNRGTATAEQYELRFFCFIAAKGCHFLGLEAILMLHKLVSVKHNSETFIRMGWFLNQFAKRL